MPSETKNRNNYTELSDSPQRVINVIHYRKTQTNFEKGNACTAILKMAELLHDTNSTDNFEIEGDIETILSFLNKYEGLLYTSRDFVGSKKKTWCCNL